MAKKDAAAPPERVALYEKLVATCPALTVKGAANPYTSVNGNMSSYLHPSGSVALRLPSETRAEFLDRYETTLFEAYGVIQKEYVRVPDGLLEDTEQLAPFFLASYRFVSTLRPKPTKR